MPRTKAVAQGKLEKLVEKLKAYVKEHKNRPFQRQPRGSKLRVFSDCAGISAETIALTLLGLKKYFTVVGGSENDDSKRCLAEAVHESCRASSRSDVFGKDIFQRNPADCPPSDIYLAGFPCPAYSKLGCRFGLRDSKKRGIPMVSGLRYIAYHKPPVVLLEQVTGFLEKKHWLARKMLRKTFAACAYTVRAKVLQTCEHGLPHSRPRLWVVALRNPTTEFRFPKALKQRPRLESILDLQKKGDEVLDLRKFGTEAETLKLWTEFWILAGCGLLCQIHKHSQKACEPLPHAKPLPKWWLLCAPLGSAGISARILSAARHSTLHLPINDAKAYGRARKRQEIHTDQMRKGSGSSIRRWHVDQCPSTGHGSSPSRKWFVAI